MGLVQREIEAAGISTVVISTIPELTASSGVPRLIAVEHPMGRTMGAPGDKERQMNVLKASLQALAVMRTPGSIEHLPYAWHESPVKARMDGAPPSPISLYLKKHPWLFPKLLSRDIPKLL